MKFTVFGSSGFVGSHLAGEIRRRGYECVTPARSDSSWRGSDLGNVIYAIGVTADFRRRPLDTVRAHVSVAIDILENSHYRTFTYLSSTRVYGGASSASEETPFLVDPRSREDLYNLSKLMGESAVLAAAGERARVVRLSNVFGPDWTSDNFLMCVLRDAVREGSVTIHSSPQSAKDYVGIADVVSLIVDIAERGKHTIYNIASGVPVTNDALASALSAATGAAITFAENAPATIFPQIDVTRIRDEFAVQPQSVLEALPSLIEQYRKAHAI